MELVEIDKLTKEFSTAREALSYRVRSLEAIITTIKQRRLPGIKSAVNAVMEAQAVLKAALEESRNLFIRPKTMIMHGVKIGFQKAKGKLSWSDDEQVVKLIRKHFPEQADVLIKTKEVPSKDALANLTVAELKKLGVTISEDGAAVVIKSTDSEIDKFVEALLKDDTQEAEAA